jgi:hypothetical protein
LAVAAFFFGFSGSGARSGANSTRPWEYAAWYAGLVIVTMSPLRNVRAGSL